MTERHLRLAFIGKKSESGTVTYHRLKDFTQLSLNRNAKTYSRKYVDRKDEVEHVSGYHPGYSYKFDIDVKNEAHKIITDITDGELTGEAAVVSILVVALDQETETNGTFKASTRDFSVVPGTEGDDSSIYTYSGSMTSVGEPVFGTATTTDAWQTASFTETAD